MDIDILITSGNRNKKVMQPIRITQNQSSKLGWMTAYESNNYRKDKQASWLYFFQQAKGSRETVSERPTALRTHFVAYLKYPN